MVRPIKSSFAEVQDCIRKFNLFCSSDSVCLNPRKDLIFLCLTPRFILFYLVFYFYANAACLVNVCVILTTCECMPCTYVSVSVCLLRNWPPHSAIAVIPASSSTSLSQQTVTYLPYGAASFRDPQQLYSYAPYLFQVPPRSLLPPPSLPPSPWLGGERRVQPGSLGLTCYACPTFFVYCPVFLLLLFMGQTHRFPQSCR